MEDLFDWVLRRVASGPGRTDQPAAAASAYSPPPAVPSPYTARMAGALTGADLRAEGLAPELDQPELNIDPNGSGVYCTWTRASGASGGIELDLWAGGEPQLTVQTILAEQSGDMSPAGLAGADDSLIGLSVWSGTGPFATIVVSREWLVFSLSIPAGPRAHDQLMSLAAVVLERVAP
jgi:hypothetical protein